MEDEWEVGDKDVKEEGDTYKEKKVWMVRGRREGGRKKGKEVGREKRRMEREERISLFSFFWKTIRRKTKLKA